MATVRISTAILGSVESSIRELYRDRIDTLKETCRVEEEEVMAIYNTIMAPHMEHIAKIPRHFFHTRTSVRVYVRSTSAYAEQFPYPVSLYEPIIIPEIEITSPIADIGPGSGYMGAYNFYLNKHPDNAALFERFSKYQQGKEAMHGAQDAALKEIRKLFEENTTVNACVKQYPPLHALLPDKIKNALAKAAPKRARKLTEAPPPVDQSALGDLTARLTTKRISK